MYKIKDLPEWKRKEYARRTAAVRAMCRKKVLEDKPEKDDSRVAFWICFILMAMITIYFFYLLFQTIWGILSLIFGICLVVGTIQGLAGVGAGVATLASSSGGSKRSVKKAETKAKAKAQMDRFEETAFWVNVFDDDEWD